MKLIKILTYTFKQEYLEWTVHSDGKLTVMTPSPGAIHL